MDKEFAYSTDKAEVVAAYLQALADRNAFKDNIRADLETLGTGPQIYYVSESFSGGRDRITALEQKGDHIPDGWRVMKRTGLLEPRRGKPGEPARQWLADHQPIDVRYVMEQHGLPRTVWLPTDSGYRIVSPKLFEYDGTLWACYPGEPGRSGGFDNKACTWTPRKMSEFYAAVEAFEAVSA